MWMRDKHINELIMLQALSREVDHCDRQICSVELLACLLPWLTNECFGKQYSLNPLF
jgi:hypothetical protein